MFGEWGVMMEVLAERLKWLREKKRLGQKEVAVNVSVTLSGYQKIEYNESNPKIDTLIRFANYFGVSSDFLLGLSDEYADCNELEEKIRIQKEKVSDLNEHISSLQLNISARRDIYSKVKMEENKQTELEKIIQDIQKQLDYYQFNHYEENDLLRMFIFDYFILYYSIPHSKPNDNDILKEYLPIDVRMDEFNVGDYRINLHSLRKNQDLGLLYWKQGQNIEENAKNAKEALLKNRELFRIKH